MAARYLKETKVWFGVQNWSDRSSGSAVVLRVEHDENGNEILRSQDSKIVKTNDDGDVFAYE